MNLTELKSQVLTFQATALAQQWVAQTFTRDNALTTARTTGKILRLTALSLLTLGILAYAFGQWVGEQYYSTEPILSAPLPEPIACTLPTTDEGDLDIVDLGTTPEHLYSLAAADLRTLCKRHNIQWRNVHGQGKHLAKAEMVDALLG